MAVPEPNGKLDLPRPDREHGPDMKWRPDPRYLRPGHLVARSLVALLVIPVHVGALMLAAAFVVRGEASGEAMMAGLAGFVSAPFVMAAAWFLYDWRIFRWLLAAIALAGLLIVGIFLWRMASDAASMSGFPF